MFKVHVEMSASLRSRLSKLSRVEIAPLLRDVEKIVESDNRRGILAGEDKDGNPLKPVTPYPGRGSGPPLAPSGGASRVVSDFDAVAVGSGKTGRIAAAWNVPWLKYHEKTRDIVGIRPRGKAEILRAIRDFLKNHARG